jgi:hypothetical protein
MMFADFRLFVPEDCGNAPKKVVLRDFHIALAKLDRAAILDAIADDIIWRITGDETVNGKDSFMFKLAQLHRDQITELRLTRIITHGSEAAVHGRWSGTGHAYDFCHIFRFSGAAKSAKIKEITSFMIQE